MADHMINIAWTEELLAKAVEKNLYYGRHMTFCRRKNEELLLVKFLMITPLISS